MSGNHELSTTWPSKFAASGAAVTTEVVPPADAEVVGGLVWDELPHAAVKAARPRAMESAKECLMARTLARSNETSMRPR
jgi:hypothetical protein